MSIVFTSDPGVPENMQNLGSLAALVGTLTFAGSYVTGGELLDLGSLFKQTGLGTVYDISGFRGYTAEYDAVNKKVKLYSAANTELAAAAYNAVLTATPCPVVIHGR